MALNFGAGGAPNPFFASLNQTRLKGPGEVAAEAQQKRVESTNQYANDLGMDFISEQNNYHTGLVEREQYNKEGSKEKIMWFNDHESTRGSMTEEWNNYRNLMGKDANIQQFTQEWKMQEAQTYTAKIGAINAYIAKNQQLGVDNDAIMEQLSSSEMTQFRDTLQRLNPELANTLQWKPVTPGFLQRTFMKRNIDTGEMSSKIGAGTAAAAIVPTAIAGKYGYDKFIKDPKDKYIKGYIETGLADDAKKSKKLLAEEAKKLGVHQKGVADTITKPNAASKFKSGAEYNTALDQAMAKKEELQKQVKEFQSKYDNKALTQAEKKALGEKPAISDARRTRAVEIQKSAANKLSELEESRKQLTSKKGRKPKGYQEQLNKLDKAITNKKDAIAKANKLLDKYEQPSRKALDSTRAELKAKQAEIKALKSSRYIDIDTKDLTKAERTLLEAQQKFGGVKNPVSVDDWKKKIKADNPTMSTADIKASAEKAVKDVKGVQKTKIESRKLELEKKARAKYGTGKTAGGPGILAYSAPMAGELVGNMIGDEEGAVAGKAVGVSFLAYASRHAPKRLAKAVAAMGARQATAGATPWTQLGMALVNIGFTGFEVYSLYQDWKNLQNK